MAGADAAKAEDNLTLLQRLRANPYVPLIIGVAAFVAIVGGLLLWAQSPDYKVLYSELNGSDGGEIISQLDQMGVPYRLAAGGQTIRVPANKVDETRLQLASEGLPKSAGVGFELMDDMPFGASQFTEHVNYNRALQGELARSIETIHAVKSARVHLAIPESSVFVRKQEKPRASVTLNLYNGRKLSREQIASILHLVSSSVSKLSTDNVTIIDTDGELLSEERKDDDGLANSTQLKYTEKVEKAYRESIIKILGPIVGRENVHAQVRVDIDFSKGEQTEELYGPNQSPYDAAVRSKQTYLNLDKSQQTTRGIPGSLSNQPPGNPASPINNPPAATTEGAGDTNADEDDDETDLALAERSGLDLLPPVGNYGSSSRNATINYELNQTIRHTQNPTGGIKRLSAAVVIDYQPEVFNENDTDEERAEKQRINDERLEKIRTLAKQAIGYSEDRGDQLSVVNIPFTQPDTDNDDASPVWWKNPVFIAGAFNVLKYLFIALIAWILWRKLVRPLLQQSMQIHRERNMPTTAVAAQQEPVLDDEAEAERLEKQRESNTRLRETARGYAQEDPELVAMIVKNWMYEESDSNDKS